MKNQKKKGKCGVVFIWSVVCICIAIVLVILMYCAIDMSQHEIVSQANDTILQCEISNKTDELNKIKDEKNRILDEINNLVVERDNVLNEIGEAKQKVYDSKGTDKYVPELAGTAKSFMCYYQVWDKDSAQYRLSQEVADMVYEENGYVKLKDRYFVAVKPYYGDVGDAIDVHLTNGIVIKCIVGDNKGMENDNEYIHHDGTIVEFMVSSTFTFGRVIERSPEFIAPIESIKNFGNYLEVINNE